jgi:ubiquitin carboxyl-terminal hydrolase 9/24
MGMTDREIKELDKDSLPEVLNSFRSFLALAKDEAESAQQTEEMQLSFAVRFLKTTYLEKRLKGVSDLRLLIEKVHARAVL